MIALALLALLQADPASSAVVAPGASQPHLALDADGNCYVAFVRGGNIELAVSTDGGKTFAPPVVALDAKGRAGAVPQRGPRVSLDSRKRIFVTAPLSADKPDGASPDLYATASSDGGKTFSKPVRINDTAGSLREALHDSAASPSGDLHVAWLDGRTFDTTALYYCKVADGAKKAGKNVLVAPHASERCAPDLAVDGRGYPSIAFVDAPKANEKKNRQTVLASTTSGTPPFKTVQVNREDTMVAACPAEAPALAVSPDAKTVALAWIDFRMGLDDRNVFWTFGEPAKLPREMPVHEDRRFYQGQPSLAVDASGAAWCCWADGREGALRVFYATSGFKGNFRVGPLSEERGGAPSVAASGKRVAVAYENGKGVSLAVLAAP